MQTGKRSRPPKGVKRITTGKGYATTDTKKEECRAKIRASSTEDVASISAGKDILMDAKKVWQNYGSMGANTTIFRCIFVFSHHGFVVAKIIGIG